MKKHKILSNKRHVNATNELDFLAIEFAEAGSLLEKKLWEKQIIAVLDQRLESGDEDYLSTLLERLFDTHAAAHDALIDLIEARAESCVLSKNNQDYDILLFSVPILAWSRFNIPTGTLSENHLQMLNVQLNAHVFAHDAEIKLIDYLFSPDQLPRNYVDTYRLTHQLGQAILNTQAFQFDACILPETHHFLSDTRYLLGAVAVRQGDPLFRWNEADKISRESVQKTWEKQGVPCLEPLFTGCSFTSLLANAYHKACFNADTASRPYTLNASIAYLQTTLNKPADALYAVIGAFHEKRLEEYRIALAVRGSSQICHGIVWPLLGAEDENSEIPADIETQLRAAGITEILIHEQDFPFEFCDGCGAPLYPNAEGETVHAEMPEENTEHLQALH